MRIAALKRSLPIRYRKFKKRFTHTLAYALRYVDKYPMRSFFAILGAILVLIILSNVISGFKPKAAQETKPVKTVSVYRIGSAPKVTVSAQVRKAGVIQVTALSGGVIDEINVQEGSSINAGDTLLSMSSNYTGANIPGVQRQIAQEQYQTNAATYDAQKEIIAKQKDLAQKNESNTEELRKITQSSLGETQDLLRQNEDVLQILETQLNTLVQNNPNPDPTTQAQIFALKQQRIQFLASTNQARQALRTIEFNVTEDKPPTEIATLNKDIVIRQLEVQEKQLAMSLEVSRLQVQVAAIAESLMFPKAPFAGIVQRVYIKEKQQVTPGTPLFVLSQTETDNPTTAVVFVSRDVASRVSRLETSTLHVSDTVQYTSTPSFVSTEAVQGTLYAVYFPIPAQYSKFIVSEGFISVEMPLGHADTSMVAPYIPLDAVYQTREKSYVFVTSGNKVASRDIEVGQVYGRYAEVVSGLKNGDEIILNRNIIEGDMIKVD